MNNWITIALIAPVAFALTNQIDKALIDRYFKGGGTNSLLIISGLIGIPTAGVVYLLNPNVIDAPISVSLLVAINGAVYLTSLIPYLKALESNDPSIVSPMFMITPIVGTILALIFLKEIPSTSSLAGSLLVLLGAALLTLKKESAGLYFNSDVLQLMFAASLLVAINGLIFKDVAQNTDFGTAFFWEYIGFAAFSLILLVGHQPSRKQLRQIVKANSNKILGINMLNEMLTVSAKYGFHRASLMAPLGIVFFTTEGTQPFFVLIFSIIIAKVWPENSSIDMSPNRLIQRVIAIILMSLGTYLFSLES